MTNDNVQFTAEMIDTVQKVMKDAYFDGEEYKVNIFNTNNVAPCSLTQMFFPQIIDMALELLKRKASISLLEWVEKKPKTHNIEYVDKESKLKNKLLPAFDWSLVPVK